MPKNESGVDPHDNSASDESKMPSQVPSASTGEPCDAIAKEVADYRFVPVQHRVSMLVETRSTEASVPGPLVHAHVMLGTPEAVIVDGAYEPVTKALIEHTHHCVRSTHRRE